MQDTRTCRERSHAFLVKAREYLDANDYEQASEKAWGAAALMVKEAAEARGTRHRSHNQLREIVETLSEETGDEELSRLFAMVEHLHTNFYESQYSERVMRRRLRDVDGFVEKMARILESQS